MALTFLQEDDRQREANEFNQTLRSLSDSLTRAQQAFSLVRSARARIDSSELFDETDLAAFDAKVDLISRQMLSAGLSLSDLVGGTVAITVDGVALTQGA